MPVKLQDRDLKIIDAIAYWKSLTAEQIGKLYFEGKNSTTLARRRINKLMTIKNIHTYRKDILSKNVYYMGSKRPNYKHDLYIVDAYLDIKDRYSIIKYKREYEIRYKDTVLRVDLMVIAKDSNNKIHAFLVEIQNKQIYKDKYTEFITQNYWQQLFGVRPEIIVYSRFNTYKSSISIEFNKLEEGV